jgi:hypothetical protein
MCIHTSKDHNMPTKAASGSTAAAGKRRSKTAIEGPPTHLLAQQNIDMSPYLIHVTTVRSHILRNWTEGLKFIISEGSMTFSPEGDITLSSMNVSETVFCFSRLLGSLFERWHVAEKTTVSVNFVQLHKVMQAPSDVSDRAHRPPIAGDKGRMRKRRFYSLCGTRFPGPHVYKNRNEPGFDDGTWKHAQAASGKTDSCTCPQVYQIALLEIPETQLSIKDKLMYPCEITVSAVQLSKVLRDLEHTSATHVQLQVKGDVLTVSGVSNQADDISHIRAVATFKSQKLAENAIDSLYKDDGEVVPKDPNEAPKVYTSTHLLKYLGESSAGALKARAVADHAIQSFSRGTSSSATRRVSTFATTSPPPSITPWPASDTSVSSSFQAKFPELEQSAIRP